MLDYGLLRLTPRNDEMVRFYVCLIMDCFTSFAMTQWQYVIARKALAFRGNL
ncbi:hypothetical protein [Helicobacter rodentium]|uniref:hypothetical protein n=1 Tax=Helicobacter rodentium TaxID=59617 RepID=UPI002356715A|nr:hypothetical protein [Helicobacter rodentium]